MYVEGTIKIQHQNQIYVVYLPKTYDELLDTFQAKFKIHKNQLNIYYIERSDNKETLVADDSDFQMAFDDPNTQVKFICKEVHQPVRPGFEPITMKMLEDTYFKKWKTNVANQVLIPPSNLKFIFCYKCQELLENQTECPKCYDTEVFDFTSSSGTIMNLMTSCIEELVLTPFKGLNDKIMSRNNKLGQSIYLDDSKLDRSKLDNSYLSLNLNTSSSSIERGKLSFFQRMASKNSDLEKNQNQNLNQSKIEQVRLIGTNNGQIAKNGEMKIESFAVMPEYCLYHPDEEESSMIISENMHKDKQNSQIQIIPEPTRKELIYDGVKITKVDYKDRYMTIGITIYNKLTVDWPSNIWIVGDKSSEITKKANTHVEKALKSKGFLNQKIVFEVSEQLIQKNQTYEMIFDFQKNDVENNTVYHSKPFVVKFNTQEEKEKSNIICDYLSFKC